MSQKSNFTPAKIEIKEEQKQEIRDLDDKDDFKIFHDWLERNKLVIRDSVDD